MNLLNAKILNTESRGNISLVNCNVNNHILQAMVIGNESTMEYLSNNNQIELLINETEITIAKDLTGSISIANQFLCEIISIQKGYLFSRIKLNFEGQELYSLLTTDVCLKLNLEKGDIVTALIKANEIFLKQKD